TGVRIAVSVAKTFAWSLGLDLIGVSSLEAMALGGAMKEQSATRNGPTWVVPLMDGRRKQAFTAVYAFEGASPMTFSGELGASWQEVLPDGIRVIGSWTEQIVKQAASSSQGQRPQEILFVGETEGFEAELEQFARDWDGVVRVLSYGIEAEFIGRLAYPRLAKGEKADVHTFVPNYTRLPEAEANLLAGIKTKKGDH
ncbi:tRNA (adenosine(37)-N6)-threonylcarbamoyltransferase complex dimerization subunit type 1 TsaB, partial [Paenibacillus sp. TAF58]